MTKPYVFKKRLLKLADYGDTIPAEKFNFARFVGSNWQGKANLSCGTTACMFGHATTIPSFRKLGLRLKYGSFWTAVLAYPCMSNIKKPNFDHTIEAAKTIFDLNKQEFEFLFMPINDLNYDIADKQYDVFGRTSLSFNATAKEVANQIRYFVVQKYQ